MHESAGDEMWIVKRKGVKNRCRSGWIEYRIERRIRWSLDDRTWIIRHWKGITIDT